MNIQTSRRAFLKSSISSAALVALAPTVPQFLLGASAHAAARKGESILVVIQLSGGNDGLNTVIPYGDDLYRRNRPLIGIAPDKVRKIDRYVGLHPSMGAFSKLLEEGQLAIVQGVGYPNPNRSHFTSMDIWQTARRDVNDQNNFRATGWLGRYLDSRSSAKTATQDIPALHLASGGPRLPLALVGQDAHATSIQSPDSFKLEDRGDTRLANAIHQAASAKRDGDDPLLGFLQNGTLAALQSSRQVHEALSTYHTDVIYPQTSLSQRLKTIAQLIDAGLSTRVYYVDLDGFDTHANQPAAHAGLLAQLSDAVAAFIKDLNQHGHGKRVLVMTFSEFGRRVHENASQGTDHGAAAPMFLAGGRVKPGLLTPHPNMHDLEEGDLKFNTDFRSVYAAALEQWLDVQSASILGGKFPPMKIVG